MSAIGSKPAAHVSRAAVVEGTLVRVSVSQIERFDDRQYAGCARRWWFTTVGGKKEPSTGAKERGTALHKEIEHYSNTGEDILSPVIRPGRHFIPIIKRDLGEGWAFPEHKFTAAKLAGVEFDGTIDLLNLSGYTLDNEGTKVVEEPGTIEICDWKTTSDIAAYGKGAAELIDTVQMPGYGSLAIEVAEAMGMTVAKVRLSHGYFQTSGKKLAEKRSRIFSVETIRSRRQDIEATVESMKSVARMTDAQHVTPNLSACSAYRGCPHAAYCPLSGSQTLASLNAPATTTTTQESTVSLRDRAREMGMVPPGQAPAQPPQHFQQPFQPSAQDIASQRAALMAEEAQARGPQQATARHQPTQPAAPQYPTCNGCNQPLHQQNTSLLADGRTLIHIGCPAAAPQIAPPDQPPSNPHTVADMVPPEMMGNYPPAVQHAAQMHNAQHAAYTQQQYQQAPAQQPQAHPIAQPAPQTVSPITPARGRGRPPGKKKGVAPPVGAPAGTGIEGSEWMLFIDCAPTEGIDAESFDPYLDEIARGLATYHKVPDLRSGGDNKSLGYGAWRGSLAAAIRVFANPTNSNEPGYIPAGAYVIYSGGEIAEVGAEALAGVVRNAGGVVVRGRR